MTNGSRGSPLIREIMHRAAALYGWDDIQPIQKTVDPVAYDALLSLVGTYTSGGMTATIVTKGDHLWVTDCDGWLADAFYPEAADTFFSTDGSPLTVQRNDRGTVVGVTYRGRLELAFSSSDVAASCSQ